MLASLEIISPSSGFGVLHPVAKSSLNRQVHHPPPAVALILSREMTRSCTSSTRWMAYLDVLGSSVWSPQRRTPIRR